MTKKFQMKVLILTADSNGGYPVPAVNGGAVSTLVEHLVERNNEQYLCDMQVLSFYDEKAVEQSKRYRNIEFKWVKVPGIVKLLDKCIFYFIRTIKKNEKAISFKSIFSLLYYIMTARQVIKETDAEKIILENNIPLAITLKKTMFKGQWYYHLHNVPRIDAHSRKVFENTAKFLCVSKYVADSICAENSAIGKIPAEKTEVLLNCVDTDLFKPMDRNKLHICELRTRYGISDNDFILIYAGRLTDEKGPDILLKAMNYLPQNVKTVIVGSLFSGTDIRTPYQDMLHELANSLENRVVFTGYIEQEELPYMYNMADVAVLPSMWEEPAGLTNIEAMACGLPVITTNSGGIPEYVGEGGAILLNRDKDIIEQLVKYINLFIDNEEYKQHCGFLGRKRAEFFKTQDYCELLLKAIN